MHASDLFLYEMTDYRSSGESRFKKCLCGRYKKNWRDTKQFDKLDDETRKKWSDGWMDR